MMKSFFGTMLNMIVSKFDIHLFWFRAPFDTMLKMIVLKLFQEYAFQQEPFGTMPNMMVLKPRNMLFIKIIVFHKILKTLLYE